MNCTRIWAISLLALVSASVCAGPSKADAFDSIREEIQRQMVQQSIPSVAVAVARGEHILWEEGFGWSDRENRVRATPHTLYTLGSVAKPITATALMRLVDRKRLDLDQPINECLGDAKVRAHVGDSSKMTLRRVAQHTAGFPGYYETFYADEPDKPSTPDGMILHYGFAFFPPGDHFHYSNFGYALLGEVIARATGKDFSDFLREEVFLPLGMHRSGVRLDTALKRHRAIRYGLDRERLSDYVTPHAPASDIYASAHDLVRFGMFHMKIRLADQQRVLSETAIDEMRRSPVPMGDEEYGLGWHLRKDAKGRQHVLHGGAGAGVDALLTLIPEEKLCVAVLANVTGGTELTRGIADRILATLLNGELKDIRPVPRPARHEADALPGKLKGKWTGSAHTHRREIAVTLWFKGSGDVHARLGEQLKTLVNDPRFSAGSFTGKMSGDIGTSAANRRPYDLYWDLTLRDGQLNGVLNAVGRHPSRGLSLGHWVKLDRQGEE